MILPPRKTPRSGKITLNTGADYIFDYLENIVETFNTKACVRLCASNKRQKISSFRSGYPVLSTACMVAIDGKAS
jgi:hypothetical protein